MPSKITYKHPSIVTKKYVLDDLPRQGELYHCPLCSVQKYKPTTRGDKVLSHLDTHHRIGVQLEEFGATALGCHLACRQEKKDKHAHYHCPSCGTTIARKEDFKKHMGNCSQCTSTEPALDRDIDDVEPDGIQSTESEEDSALGNEDSRHFASMECVDGEQTGIDTNPAPVESVCCEEDKIEPNPVHHYPVEEKGDREDYHDAQMMDLKKGNERALIHPEVAHQTHLDRMTAFLKTSFDTSIRSRDSSPYEVNDGNPKSSYFDDKVEEIAPQMISDFTWKKVNDTSEVTTQTVHQDTSEVTVQPIQQEQYQPIPQQSRPMQTECKQMSKRKNERTALEAFSSLLENPSPVSISEMLDLVAKAKYEDILDIARSHYRELLYLLFGFLISHEQQPIEILRDDSYKSPVAGFSVGFASGNGDCLYNSISLLLTGTEDIAHLLRLCSGLFGILHTSHLVDEYKTKIKCIAEALQFLRTICRDETIQRIEHVYGDTHPSVEEYLTFSFAEEAQAGLREETYSGYLQFVFLSSVLRQRIEQNFVPGYRLEYPPVCHCPCITLDSEKVPLNVAWVGPDGSAPNHIVPLIPNKKMDHYGTRQRTYEEQLLNAYDQVMDTSE